MQTTTKTKYYYEIKEAVKPNQFLISRMTQGELIEDLARRIDDYLLIDFPELAAERAIIVNTNLPFDQVKFPLMQKAYAKDNVALIRAENPSQLEQETDFDF